MLLNIGRLKRATGTKEKFSFQQQLDTETKGADQLELVGPVTVSGEAVNNEGTLEVTGSVTVDAVLICSRCLKSFNYSVEASFEKSYRLNPAVSDDQDSEGLETISGDQLDLSELIRESILLEIPMKQVCSAECKGLCTKCGKDLNTGSCDCVEDNIDPRLEVLKKLLKS